MRRSVILGGLLGGLMALILMGDALFSRGEDEPFLYQLVWNCSGWYCEKDPGRFVPTFLGIMVLGGLIGAVAGSKQREKGFDGSGSPKPIFNSSAEKPEALDPEEKRWQQANALSYRIVLELESSNFDDLWELSEHQEEYTKDLSDLIREYKSFLRSNVESRESQIERKRLTVQILGHPALGSIQNANAALRDEERQLGQEAKALQYLSELHNMWTECDIAPVQHSQMRNRSDVTHIYEDTTMRFLQRLAFHRLSESAANSGMGAGGIDELLHLLVSFNDIYMRMGRLNNELRLRKKSRLSADEVELGKEFRHAANEIIRHDQLSDFMSRLAEFDSIESIESRRKSVASRKQQLHSQVAGVVSMSALEGIDVETLSAPFKEAISETTSDLMDSEELQLVGRLAEHGESMSNLVELAGLEIDPPIGLEALLDDFRMINRRLAPSRSDRTTIDQERMARIVYDQYVLAIQILNHQDLLGILSAIDGIREVDSLVVERNRIDDGSPSNQFVQLIDQFEEYRAEVSESSASLGEAKMAGYREDDPLKSGPIGLACSLVESSELVDEMVERDCAALADSLSAFRRLMRQLEPIQESGILHDDHPLVQTVHEAAMSVLGDSDLSAIVDDVRLRVRSSTIRVKREQLDLEIAARQFLLERAEEVAEYSATRNGDVDASPNRS